MKFPLCLDALRGRLLVGMLRATLAPLLLVFAAALLVQGVSLHEQHERELNALAKMLAAPAGRALAANDPAAADAVLDVLRSRSDVVLAVIQFPSGELLARYRRDGRQPLPAEGPPPSELGTRYRAGHLDVHAAVAFEGQRVGLLWLRSDSRQELLALRRSATWLASAWLGAGLLGLFLAWRLERSRYQPIRQLLEALRRVAAAEYDVRVPEAAPAELAELARGFNQMLADLRERLAEIELQRGGLADAVAERTRELSRANRALERAVRDLTEARDLAEAGSRAKSQFLANMSHEIRTPMNGVLGMTELLLRSPLATPQRRMAETVRRSGEALLHIINDILDFSRIEAGRLELERADFDLQETIEDTVESLAARAHARGLELISLVDSALPRLLRGDAARLRQVLTNLVGNAIKFTERGEVTVRARSLLVERRFVLVGIEVRDTGVGIPRDAAARIFDAFAQADGSTTRRYGGTGLGLAISRQLAALMGGNIDFDSEPGRGSSFRFTARFERATHAEDAQPAPPQLQSGLRVLVVDDNAASRQALGQQCARLGAQAGLAGTADEALERLREAARCGEPCAVALVDLRMPGTDGLQLARAVRRERVLDATRIVLMVTMDETAYWADATDEGLAHLMKPVRLSALARCLAAPQAEVDPVPAAAPTPSAAGDGALASCAASVSHAPTDGTSTGSRGRVLVVEDSPVNQEVAREWLVQLGYEVDLADNGAAALAAWERRSYVAILMDCMMPVLDGYEATAELRRCERHEPGRGRTFIVAVTANAMAGDRDRCLATGMDAYLAKPYTSDGLAAVLRERPGARAAAQTPAQAAPAAPAALAEAAASAPVTSQTIPSAGADRAPTAERLDASVLASLRALRAPGESSLLERVVGLYLKHAPGQLEAARAALAGEDHEALRRAVHTLKSSSANVGALGLSELCRRLEADLREGWRADARERLDRIAEEFEGVREALRRLEPREVA